MKCTHIIYLILKYFIIFFTNVYFSFFLGKLLLIFQKKLSILELYSKNVI